MSLEVLSTAVYHDTAKPVAKPRVEAASVQETGGGSLNITELPSTSRVAGTAQTTGGQTTGGQNNGQSSGQKETNVSERQIKDAVSKVNNQLKSHRTRCEFSYHEETKRVSIKVIDKETQEVVREIPPEQTLEMVEKMWELAGFLVDEKR